MRPFALKKMNIYQEHEKTSQDWQKTFAKTYIIQD